MSDTTQEFDAVEDRSEIAILWDAELCNPNGDPLADDRPRRNDVTNRGIVTDVRMKRYIRDQLADDNHQIFIRSAETEDGTRMRRDELLLDAFEGVATVEEINEVKELFDGRKIGDVFLDTLTDIRYFGVTLSFSGDTDDIEDDQEEFYSAATEELPATIEGPVQFSHARSLHPVHIAEHAEKLAPIVQGKTGKEQGTFADDYRIRYGMYAMHGVVNENAASNARLNRRDVSRLDNTIWRSLTNQTLTRSKFGQTPRLYVRVKYTDSTYYDGSLRNAFDLDESSKDHTELETVDDVAVDISGLVNALQARAEGIEKVRLKSSPLVRFTDDGTLIEKSLKEYLTSEAGVDVESVAVSEEADTYRENGRKTAAAYDLE
jgi:CRISPR-associated protein Csh2